MTSPGYKKKGIKGICEVTTASIGSSYGVQQKESGFEPLRNTTGASAGDTVTHTALNDRHMPSRMAGRVGPGNSQQNLVSKDV
jgi:hypothetical protein